MQEEFYHQRWREAGITNDFIFGNVMQMGNNCLNLLRAILPELHLQQISFVNSQKDIRTDHFRKGVRLDVFAVDDQQRVYDIEMQVKTQPTIGKRVRYYQSKIDADALRSGENVDKIKISYIIFLMPKDQFGLNRRQYTFHYWCDEEPDLKLATASHLIFLNSTGTKGKVSQDLQSFFDLMNKESSSKGFANRISKDIEKVKADQAKERDFMDLAMKMHDVREDEQIQIAKKLVKQQKSQGISETQILNNLEDLFHDSLRSEDLKGILKSVN